MALGHVKALSSYLTTMRTTLQAGRKHHPSVNTQESQLPTQPPVFTGSGLGGTRGPLPLLRWTDNSWSDHIFGNARPHKPGSGSSSRQPRAWVSSQPSFSFPRTNFSLPGCQSRTEIVGRGTSAHKSMSSPHKTSHLQPRNRPERGPTVRQARPLQEVPWGGGTHTAQRSRLPAVTCT